MPINKSRAAKTARDVGKTKNSRAPRGEVWDKTSAVQEFDGRVNTQAGDAGKEPGGRWSAAYYESGPKIITRDNVKDG